MALPHSIKTGENFINLCYYKDDFGMDAEWHFVTSHGKVACDGIGEQLKGVHEEPIMTPRQLYKWAVIKIPSVTFEYCTFGDHSKETMLKERFRKA
jgi:hypothetical protein